MNYLTAENFQVRLKLSAIQECPVDTEPHFVWHDLQHIMLT